MRLRIYVRRAVAIAGDATNHLCHWGTEGAGYLDADATVSLSRLLIGYELGLIVVGVLCIELGAAH